MSDWVFLNRHRVRVSTPTIDPRYCSDDSYGFNGMFRLPYESNTVRCIASDGTDFEEDKWKWQHVSVSVEYDKRPPRWSVMCWVKDLFWDVEDWVVQFHPARSQYVNYHPACLHLWRPLKEHLPTPLSIMVGPRKEVPNANPSWLKRATATLSLLLLLCGCGKPATKVTGQVPINSSLPWTNYFVIESNLHPVQTNASPNFTLTPEWTNFVVTICPESKMQFGLAPWIAVTNRGDCMEYTIHPGPTNAGKWVWVPKEPAP